MGLFHCPMGSIYRDDDPCIDCGLCEAITKEDKIKATEIIREYLRSHTKTINSVSKKMTICGKGGVGKSTFITLISNVLSELGYSVLVLDTDESNPGLYRMLGLDKEPKPLKNVLRGRSTDDSSPPPEWLLNNEITTSDIPEEFFVEKSNLKFLSIGKIIDPFEGCACSMADVARNFLDKLVLQENERLIVDMEAGVESFGRGVERSVDTVLIIVEPSFESIALAEKISYMADGIGVNKVRAVLNKIPSKDIEVKIQDKLSGLNIKSLGSIYFNLQVNEASFEGHALGESEAKDNVKDIVRSLLNGE
ncbi:MAG: P-loop NTPase [Desulfobacterales bacterium]|nr:P-loop NTPase [Desulfobacterales bacterium]